MLLPDPLLPELPCDAELPDWPLPDAADPEPLPLPLWAIANAAETIRIAKICNKRFIIFPSSSLLSLFFANWVCGSTAFRRLGLSIEHPVAPRRARRLTGAGTVGQATNEECGTMRTSGVDQSVAERTIQGKPGRRGRCPVGRRCNPQLRKISGQVF